MRPGSLQLKSNGQMTGRLRDRAALAEMVRAHHGFLIRTVTPLVTRDFAEDVVQETWIKAFAALDRFEGRSSLRTWLARIALNTACSWRRGRCHEAGEVESGGETGARAWLGNSPRTDGEWSDLPNVCDHNTPEELLTETELRQCLQRCVWRLPPEQHTVLRLREIEGLEHVDISAITGTSVGNVRVLLHRARQNLHLIIEHFDSAGACWAAEGHAGLPRDG